MQLERLSARQVGGASAPATLWARCGGHAHKSAAERPTKIDFHMLVLPRDEVFCRSFAPRQGHGCSSALSLTNSLRAEGCPTHAVYPQVTVPNGLYSQTDAAQWTAGFLAATFFRTAGLARRQAPGAPLVRLPQLLLMLSAKARRRRCR